MKNPAPQSARGFRKLREIHSSSLAVFYVEQVALNRHDIYVKNASAFISQRSDAVKCNSVQYASLIALRPS